VTTAIPESDLDNECGEGLQLKLGTNRMIVEISFSSCSDEGVNVC